MDINSFSENLRTIIMKAPEQATTAHHTEITSVHLLDQIFLDSTIDGLFKRINLDKKEAHEICQRHLKNVPVVDYTPQPIFNRKVTESFSDALNWAKEHDEVYLTVATCFIFLVFNKSNVSNSIVRAFGLDKQTVIDEELKRKLAI